MVALAVVPVAVVVAGCSDGASTPAASTVAGSAPAPAPPPNQPDPLPVTPRNGGTLTYGLASLRSDWDPASGPFDADAFQVGRAVYDTLLVYDDSNDLTPFLATEVKASDDLLTWTITLRDGVRFHDGRPLTAAAVVRELDQARASTAFEAALRPIREVTARDARTVVVATRTPWSAFPHLLPGQLGMVAASGGSQPIGTGPFRLPGLAAAPATSSTTPPGTASGGGATDATSTSAAPTTAAPTTTTTDPSGAPSGSLPGTSGTPGTTPSSSTAATGPDVVRLERNPAYWQQGLPRLDGVVFRAVPDESARASLLRAGTLDVGLFRDPARLAVFAEEAKRNEVQHLVDPSGETPELALVLQTDRTPFEDPVARQAVSQAVDRDAIAADVFGGQYPPAEGPYSEGARWYGRAPWPIHDILRARDTVETYTKQHGEALRFRILAPPTPMARDLVDALRRQLAEAGIQVDAEYADADQVARRLVAGQYEAALVSGFGGWHPDQDEPVLRGFVPASVPAVGAPKDAPPAIPLPAPDPATPPWATNITRFRNENIDRALDTARTTQDISKQADQYTSVQETLARESPYVFLVHEQTAVVARPDVRDLLRWTTPAGTPGISQFRGTVALAQAWLAR